MGNIEETTDELAKANEELDGAWNTASEAKEELVEGQRRISRIAGAEPPTNLKNALEMLVEAYDQIQQGQALLVSAQDQVVLYVDSIGG